MQAIEFHSIVREGSIRVPEHYKDFQNQRVRVIVLIDNKPNQKKQLAAVFEKMKHKKMFRRINNPTAWQKQLRDEWD
ncbi:MAG: hypothetical protein AAF806_21830 [Bacteroidota bacterium]